MKIEIVVLCRETRRWSRCFWSGKSRRMKRWRLRCIKSSFSLVQFKFLDLFDSLEVETKCPRPRWRLKATSKRNFALYTSSHQQVMQGAIDAGADISLLPPVDKAANSSAGLACNTFFFSFRVLFFYFSSSFCPWTGSLFFLFASFFLTSICQSLALDEQEILRQMLKKGFEPHVLKCKCFWCTECITSIVPHLVDPCWGLNWILVSSQLQLAKCTAGEKDCAFMTQVQVVSSLHPCFCFSLKA